MKNDKQNNNFFNQTGHLNFSVENRRPRRDPIGFRESNLFEPLADEIGAYRPVRPGVFAPFVKHQMGRLCQKKKLRDHRRVANRFETEPASEADQR